MRLHYFAVLLILLAMIGSANAITKTSLTEINWSQSMPADLKMGTYKITGLGNGTAAQDAVSYSQVRDALPVVYFDGTTVAALNTKIATIGSGTYILKNALTCNAAVNISTPGVVIMGEPNARDSSAGTITTTLASGDMITVSANDVTFRNIKFVCSNTTSTTNLVKLAHPTTNKNYINFIDCYWYVGYGTCLYIGDHIQRVYLQRCELLGASEAHGYGIYGNGVGADCTNVQDSAIGTVAYGVYLVRLTAFSMTGGIIGYNGLSSIYMNPTAGGYTADCWIRNVLLDQGSSTGQTIYSTDTYTQDGFMLFNCRIIQPAPSTTPIVMSKINKFTISNNVISVTTSPGNIMNFQKSVTNGTICNNVILAMTGYGINVDSRTGTDINKNLVINDNLIKTTGTGIYIGANSYNYVLNDNLATVDDHGTTPHSIADNVAVSST